MTRLYDGEIAGLTFKAGVLTTPEARVADPDATAAAMVGYMRRHGLEFRDGKLVVLDRPAAGRPDYPDAVRVGTPLRDATVNPRPRDHTRPVGATVEDVPDGTVKDVMAWVDGDPARAQAARDAEMRRPADKWRVSLMDRLHPLLDRTHEEA